MKKIIVPAFALLCFVVVSLTCASCFPSDRPEEEVEYEATRKMFLEVAELYDRIEVHAVRATLNEKRDSLYYYFGYGDALKQIQKQLYEKMYHKQP